MSLCNVVCPVGCPLFQDPPPHPNMPLILLELKELIKGNIFGMEPVLKPCKILTRVAAKGPKGPTWELLAKFEALWLAEFTRFCYYFWYTDTRAIGLCTVKKSALGDTAEWVKIGAKVAQRMLRGQNF